MKRISDGWVWSALIAISFLGMLCAKLFAGWAISWWIVTLPIWVLPALVICITGLCMVALAGVGIFTILLKLFYSALTEKDDYDDYDD